MRAQSVVAGILAVLFLAGCANTREAEAQPETQDESAEQVQTETPRTSYEDTALVGNSHVSGFFTYNALPGAACYYRVGLNVNSVFEQPMTQGDDTETPVIELLKNKDFSHIIFFFGENELGWSNREAFIEEYTEVIETARSYCPDAVIYLSAIPPVSAEVSAQNENNTNNTSIQACNEEIKQIAADNDAVYVDAFAALAGGDGSLPDNAAADGIHPAEEYTQKWAELLKQSIAEAENK